MKAYCIGGTFDGEWSELPKGIGKRGDMVVKRLTVEPKVFSGPNPKFEVHFDVKQELYVVDILARPFCEARYPVLIAADLDTKMVMDVFNLDTIYDWSAERA